MLWRWSCCATLLLMVAVASSSIAHAQRKDGPVRLLEQVAKLHVDGRFAEAEPVARRLFLETRAQRGEAHADFARATTWLARTLDALGLFANAEPLYKQAIAIWEQTVGSEHPSFASTLNYLARMYQRQERNADAEALYKRALSVFERANGPDHTSVAGTLSNLAFLYRATGRYSEAEPFFKRALAIQEKAVGPDHHSVGTALDNLAVLYRTTGRYAEAEPLFLRGLAIREKALGPHHPSVAGSLANLGALYKTQARYAEAEPLYRRSLAIREKTRGTNHPDVAKGFNNLALLYFAQSQWAAAVDQWRHSTAVTIRRADLGDDEIGQALAGRAKGEAEQVSERFRGLVKAAYRFAELDKGQVAPLAGEMFQMAQWSQTSEAATSLAQMAARGAKGDVVLAGLIRERQDLVTEWQKLDSERLIATAQPSEKRNRPAEAAMMARLKAIDTRVAQIDKRLAQEFPDYSAMARPTPLSIEQVQAHLATDEALLLLLDTPAWRPTQEETFIWVVTKTDMRWIRSRIGTPGLTREVAALRCGLDVAVWDSEAGAARCTNLVKAQPQRDTQGNVRSGTLPFDIGRAQALYRALFGEVQDLINEKHLLIVPSGPLTQLPPHVMVKNVSGSTDYRSAEWLARKHVITVLPAVSSLAALRRVAKSSGATKPMLGIGNPLLDGDPRRPWEVAWAKLARTKQDCKTLPMQQTAEVAGGHRRVVPLVRSTTSRVDVGHLRTQVPLHDTADELCKVATELNLGPDDVMLGSRATEESIKRLNASRILAHYRVVHFATHATLAGEISGTTEPGLILTPPGTASDTDDGFLSASEVAALILDADWVILSACNTAAGGADGGQALSGLARAFMYAGARALLVSHWAVDSAATVKLVTSAVGAITRDATLGRAQAMQRAMLALIENGEAHEAHPTFWAPFVVVGEGAAAR